MTANKEAYLRPSTLELWFNKFMGKLASWGFAPSYMYLLSVPGRKSGKIYSTPVNVMDVDGVDYLVAPRGTTSWVRNARASGEVTLKQGRSSITYRLEELPNADKPPLLKEYLDRYQRAVQVYFTIQAGSAVEDFASVASDYPVFRLVAE